MRIVLVALFASFVVLPSAARAFDCSNPFMSTTAVICSDERLKQVADERQQAFERALSNVPGPQKKDFIADQQRWIHAYSASCGVPDRFGPAPKITGEIVQCFLREGTARTAYLVSVMAAPSSTVTQSGTDPGMTPFHHPPIGPGRSCDNDSMRDPYTALICTDDSLAAAWLVLNQQGYALRQQMGDDAYHGLMRAEGNTSWKQLTSKCPIPNDKILTDQLRSSIIPCIRQQIYELSYEHLPLLSSDARQEATREIHAHISLQKELISRGYLSGDADGSYGPATRDAISRFQKDHDLPVSGFMTDATSQALTRQEIPGIAAGNPPSPTVSSQPKMSDVVPKPQTTQPILNPVLIPAPLTSAQNKPNELSAVDGLVAAGNASDLLAIVNVAPSAPHASVDLNGEPTFIGNTATICINSRTSFGTAEKLSIDGWLKGHGLDKFFSSLIGCQNSDMADLDLVITERGHIPEIPEKLLKNIDSKLRSKELLTITEMDARAQDLAKDDIDRARLDSESKIKQRSPGFGYVSFSGSGNKTCVTVENPDSLWSELLKDNSLLLVRDLGYGFEPEIISYDANAAYSIARRGGCRIIVGSADQLAAVLKAAVRDNLEVLPGTLWISKDVVDAVLEKHRRQREMEAKEQSDRAALLAQQQQERVLQHEKEMQEILKNQSSALIQQTDNKKENGKVLNNSSSSSDSAEDQFLNAIEVFKKKSKDAANELAQGGTFPARAAALCRIIPDGRITGWHATIDELSTNGDGNGVLTLRLSRDVTIGTWDNVVSDLGSNTLIPSSSDLFHSLATMAKGDHVLFDAKLLREDEKCFDEGSVTMAGSMNEPEFKAVIIDVHKAN